LYLNIDIHLAPEVKAWMLWFALLGKLSEPLSPILALPRRRQHGRMINSLPSSRAFDYVKHVMM
jgi:hypothetical protein